VPPVPRLSVATNSSVSQGSTVVYSGEVKKKLNVHSDSVR
jgi:nicotinamide mononucleotide (NMN) deamidase PncC